MSILFRNKQIQSLSQAMADDKQELSQEQESLRDSLSCSERKTLLCALTQAQQGQGVKS